MMPEISIVIATYNRAGPLGKLLETLQKQTLTKDRWEIIVAVDGSEDDSVNVLDRWMSQEKISLTWFYQENAGQCVARHNAILRSHSDKIIIIDDDMVPCSDFVESHLRALDHNDAKTVVIGKVVPTEGWERRPLYELVREYSTAARHHKFEIGLAKPTGEDFVTQNVSFHKKLYLEAGGFDPDMRLGEDTALGIEFERAGGRFVYCKDAWAIHDSNIGSYEAWLKRQYDYGKFAWLAWKKSEYYSALHPLKSYCCTGSKVTRWAIWLSIRSDFTTNQMVSFLRIFGDFMRKINLLIPAVMVYKAIISIKQHQGLRDIYGSWCAFKEAAREFKAVRS